MRDVELARRRTFVAPGLDEFAVPVELHNARIGVSTVPVGDENIAVRRRDDGGRRIEFVAAAAGLSGLAEGEQQFSVRAELENLMAFAVAAEAVGHPYIAVTVDMEAMWKQDHAGAEAFEQLAGRVELQDRIELGLRAGERRARIDLGRRTRFAAALADPYAGAVRIDRDRAGRAPYAAVG